MTSFNVVFDLDDTLMPNSWRYAKAKFRCGYIIADAFSRKCASGSADWIRWELTKATYACGIIIVDALGNDSPYNSELLRRVRDLSSANLSKQASPGFRADYFQRNWVSAYELFCTESGRSADPLISEKLVSVTQRFSRNPQRSACTKLTAEDLSFFGERLIELQGRIDGEKIRQHGLSRHLFPDSWIEAYQVFCNEVSQEPDPVVARKVRGAAARFQRGPFRAYPDAIEALRQIRGMGHVLHLVTAGENKLQRRKIEQAGLGSFFEGRIHVVSFDKRNRLKTIANGQPKNTIMVGDSLRIDVAAAVDVGVRAVLIPIRVGWPEDDVQVEKDAYTVIKAIRDLPAHITKWSEANGNGRKKRKSRQKRRKSKRLQRPTPE
ncbi:HAD family hydrolase [Patescibacteria group bacterium]|nr:HAD family hydrolase [Patescibacteria group bacterium]MBU1029546.1 HAD family hydrolase [Patescibacteria group bacterium]MBU1915544.1 HAD family hydrolase [Patescibacteria group bacterium]